MLSSTLFLLSNAVVGAVGQSTAAHKKVLYKKKTGKAECDGSVLKLLQFV